MSKDKIVFLDIDGVVNTLQIDTRPFPDSKLKQRHDGFYVDLCGTDEGRVSNRQAVMWLNKLCKETGAKIVISSTWRYCEKIYTTEECLRNTGLLPEIAIIGKTPVMHGFERGDEISWWLGSNYGEDMDKVSFVILDDDADMGELIDHLAQCDTFHGFGCSEYIKAKEILKK